MGKYQNLNLEQKMAKIRKKMPSLLKRFYNDDADYDFATLDDIYKSMTPALNKYGVNFDIVKETPTQYDPEGKPAYLTQAEDEFWRYESDMVLCWTNIDNPKEERHVMIHILGTHEIPDKARGTAMTYGLKYYFRNKFCMRQLDSVLDDPDGMEYGTEKYGTEESGTKPYANSPSGDKKSRSLEPVKSYPGKQNAKTDRNPACADGGSPDGKEQRGTKTDKNAALKKEPGRPKEQPSEKPETTGKQSGQEESARQQAAASGQPGDGFQAVQEEEVPFEDGSFMDKLEKELEEESGNAGSDLEAAKKYTCTFGLYDGKTLGEIMNSGLKGCETIKWIANRYKGPDAEMVKAAKLLLENQDLVMEKQAA